MTGNMEMDWEPEEHGIIEGKENPVTQFASQTWKIAMNVTNTLPKTTAEKPARYFFQE